jgi:hypothetical protein
MEFLRDNGMKKAFQPVYSPNLAVSDFYPFGHVKGCSIAKRNHLRQAILALLNRIEKWHSRIFS